MQFAAREKVLHEHLAALNVELARVRDERLSAAQWKAAQPCMDELIAAAALCRDRLRGLTQVDSDAAGC